jgi:integrase
MASSPSSLPRIPAYGLHRPTGQARVILNGRHVYLGRYGSPDSWEKYHRLVAEQFARPFASSTLASAQGSELTIIELIAAYWRFAENYYVKDGSPTDHLHLVRRALGLLRQLYGHQRAISFGPRCLHAIQEKLVSEGKARTHINGLCGVIRRAFKWAVSQELLPVQVHQALTTVSGLKKGRTAAREPAPVLPVSDEVLAATLPHLPPVVADMVQLQRLLGCRPGEICQLRPVDLDRSDQVWIYRPQSHKTEHHGKQRQIPLGPKAQAILRPYLLRPAETYCFSPAECRERRFVAMRAARKSRVQPSQLNRRKPIPRRKPRDNYGKDAYIRAIRRACDRADRAAHDAAPDVAAETRIIPRWSPNQLRHAAATEIRRRFGLEAAQVVLGHSKADVTQVYAERDAALAVRVMREIG